VFDDFSKLEKSLVRASFWLTYHSLEVHKTETSTDIQLSS